MWGCERGADTADGAPTNQTCAPSVCENHSQTTNDECKNHPGGTSVCQIRLGDKNSVCNIPGSTNNVQRESKNLRAANSQQSVCKPHTNPKTTNSVSKNHSRPFNCVCPLNECKNRTVITRRSEHSVCKTQPKATSSVKPASKNNSNITNGVHKSHTDTVYCESQLDECKNRTKSSDNSECNCIGAANSAKSVCSGRSSTITSVNSVCRNRLRASRGFLLLLLLVLLSLRGSAGTVSLGAQLVCSKAPGLTEKQRALCRASPAAMAAIADGLRMAYAECRSQLAGRRWNCSGVGDGTHFGHVMPWATREAAFTYAITSAGVTHALSEACSRGELPACGCNNRRRAVSSEQWEWSGARCGEAAYGARLARRFLDARELERDARAAMNLHNNRLGRKIVKELVRRECKCHGVSGSCAVRTCWRAVPHFRAVGAALRDKYIRAKQVSPIERSATVEGRVNIQLVVKRPRQPLSASRPARKNELVFLTPSPTYCEPDPSTGSLGTHGRHCNNTSRGDDGCESLCCGRGYSTERRSERVQCHCRFHWCCRVRCDTCTRRTEQHLCN